MIPELQQRIVACYKINYLIIICIKGNWVPENLGPPRLSYQNDSRSGWGWGIHVTPWLIHVNVWQKPLQYCKVISLQLIKINGRKKKTILLSSVLYIEFMHKISLGKKEDFLWKMYLTEFLSLMIVPAVSSFLNILMNALGSNILSSPEFHWLQNIAICLCDTSCWIVLLLKKNIWIDF